MPSRNIVKMYDTSAYYHVYNRGVEKRKIFIDDQDYAVFSSLFKRHLDEDSDSDSRGRMYDCLSSEVEITAFCLMPNHFHILIYQIGIDSVTKLLRAVCSSYVTYFNKKYDRVGSLFQGTFKAVRVNNDGYLLYLTRYIHRNPSKYLDWQWSSLGYWIGKKSAHWINPQRLSDMSSEKYLDFIKDDKAYEESIEDISDIIF